MLSPTGTNRGADGDLCRCVCRCCSGQTISFVKTSQRSVRAELAKTLLIHAKSETLSHSRIVDSF